MKRKVVFVTNAKEYSGAPAASALANSGWDVFCHDDSFVKSDARNEFERENPNRYAAAGQDAESFVAEGLSRLGKIDALISNDIPKDPRGNANRITTTTFLEMEDRLDGFEMFLDSLIKAPVRLLRAALPAMRAGISFWNAMMMAPL